MFRSRPTYTLARGATAVLSTEVAAKVSVIQEDGSILIVLPPGANAEDVIAALQSPPLPPDVTVETFPEPDEEEPPLTLGGSPRS